MTYNCRAAKPCLIPLKPQKRVGYTAHFLRYLDFLERMATGGAEVGGSPMKPGDVVVIQAFDVVPEHGF